LRPFLISGLLLLLIVTSSCQRWLGEPAIQTTREVTSTGVETSIPTRTLETPAPPVAAASTPTPGLEPAAMPEPTGESPLGQESSNSVERTFYDLRARLDYARRRVDVQAEITYLNKTNHNLEELLFLVDANRYLGAFQLGSVSLDEGGQPSSYILENDRLTITLPAPLASGESAQISFVYTLQIPVIPPPNDIYKPQPFGYTERQLNLVDWYPYLPPYQEETGWAANQAWFFGEHQVYEAADFTVAVETINPPADLVLAASALPEQDGNNYLYNHANARNFALSASHMYEVRYEEAGDVLVIGYSFPYDLQAGEAALRDTAEAVRLYNRLFGPYPHKALTLVEADFLDGMEYDGLYFLSRGFYNLYDGSPQGYLTTIAVHETAHQWWYGLVGNDQAYEPWLDEALCTYSELLFFENVYPEVVSWWWDYRIDYYEPGGFIDGSIYDYGGFRPYRDAVYLNGALFLHEIRQAAGDKAFFEFLKDYARRLSGSQATQSDFFSILSEHTHIDTSEIKDKYFRDLY
jgi:hypothetical protein